jgi:Anthrone oxygenase
MNRGWAMLMLFSAGLFAGGVVSIAWERIPAWRRTNLAEFQVAFAHTLRWVDRLQPALLVISLASTIGFAVTADGSARVLALVAAAGFLLVLIGSAAWLVPIQRRLVAPGEPTSQALDRLRTQWLRGHLIRTGVSLTSLILAIFAATA